MALKTENAHFLPARHCFCLQGIKISFNHDDFYTKISLILHTPAKNSITQLTLLCTATKDHSGTVGFPCFAFWSVQPKPLKVGSMLIPHFKALICGYLL